MYEAKLKAAKSADTTCFKLAWEVKEVEELIQLGRKLVVEMNVIGEWIMDPGCSIVIENIAKRLTALRDSLSSFVKSLSKHQREAATHIFVIMISSECRSRKPYALPVQCLPVKGLKDMQVYDEPVTTFAPSCDL